MRTAAVGTFETFPVSSPIDHQDGGTFDPISDAATALRRSDSPAANRWKIHRKTVGKINTLPPYVCVCVCVDGADEL